MDRGDRQEGHRFEGNLQDLVDAADVLLGRCHPLAPGERLHVGAGDESDALPEMITSPFGASARSVPRRWSNSSSSSVVSTLAVLSALCRPATTRCRRCPWR